MITPTLSLIYVAILALMHMALTYNVIRIRITRKIVISTGRHDGMDDERAIFRATRAHGNFIETVPMAALLFMLIEMYNGCPMIVHGFFLSLIIGRLLHAHAMLFTSGRSWSRVWGMLFTTIPVFLGIIYTGLMVTGVLNGCFFLEW